MGAKRLLDKRLTTLKPCFCPSPVSSPVRQLPPILLLHLQSLAKQQSSNRHRKGNDSSSSSSSIACLHLPCSKRPRSAPNSPYSPRSPSLKFKQWQSGRKMESSLSIVRPPAQGLNQESRILPPFPRICVPCQPQKLTHACDAFLDWFVRTG